MFSDTVHNLLALLRQDKSSRTEHERKLSAQQRESGPMTSRRELFLIFLKIGCLSFGGFMALIAVIENEIVKRRNLINHSDLLDAIALANLLPGPQAVNVVAFVGHRLYGGIGALLCAFSVLLPSFILVLVFSYIYFEYGHIAGIQKAFQGFLPAIAAIVFSVAWTMSKKVVKNRYDIALVAVAVLMMVFAPAAYRVYVPIVIVILYGALGFGYYSYRAKTGQQSDTQTEKPKFDVKSVILPLGFLLFVLVFPYLPHPFQDNQLILLSLTLASLSLMLFGGGYVFIPMIGSIVVLQYGWLTQQEFADGIAIGQLTPGPILISAAFIGYKVSSWLGAIVATIAIYAPPAILMVVMTHIYGFFVHSSVTKSVMHIIHCGVIGMIIIAGFVLMHLAAPNWTPPDLMTWTSLGIFVLSLIALIKFKLNIVIIIPAAGLLAYLIY